MLPLPPWMETLTKMCVKFNVEPELVEQTANLGIKKIKFNCAQQLAGEEQAALIRALPQDVATEFTVFPKKYTINMITMVLGMLGIKLDSIDYTEARELELKAHADNVPIKIVSNFPGLSGKKFKITTYMDDQSTVWRDLSYVMKLDGAVDNWKFFCENLNFTKDVKGLPSEMPEDVGVNPKKYLGEVLERVLREVVEQNPEAAARAAEEFETPPSFESGQEIDGIPHTEQPYDRPERISPLFDMSKNRKASKASTPNGHDGVVRDICPTTDEIIDLKIALGQVQDVNDFLKAIEGGK